MVGAICFLCLLMNQPAHAALLQISQYGLEEITGQRITFRAYVNTAKATMDPVVRAFGDGVYVSSFTLGAELHSISLDLGSETIHSDAGTWRVGGELAQPNAYDGYSSFAFDDLIFAAPEGRIYERITMSEWASWGNDPLAGLMLSHALGSKLSLITDSSFNTVLRLQYGSISNLEITEVPESGMLGLMAIGLLGLRLRRKPPFAESRE